MVKIQDNEDLGHREMLQEKIEGYLAKAKTYSNFEERLWAEEMLYNEGYKNIDDLRRAYCLRILDVGGQNTEGSDREIFQRYYSNPRRQISVEQRNEQASLLAELEDLEKNEAGHYWDVLDMLEKTEGAFIYTRIKVLQWLLELANKTNDKDMQIFAEEKINKLRNV